MTQAPARQRRGLARRESLLRATLEVVGEHGVHATTHRAVAAQAGVPPSTIGYYFASLDELLVEALELFVSEEVERVAEVAQRLADSPPEQIVHAVADELLRLDRARGRAAVSQFELYLEASRRPALRPAAVRSQVAYADLAREVLRALGAEDPEESARTVVALLDGLALQRIIAPSGDDGRRIVRAVEGLLGSPLRI